MNKILAINGSYRKNGITDQVVNALVKEVERGGAKAEIILLRDYPINFCTNCRECTQQPGESPGKCIQHDGMEALIQQIEQADGYILAAPTNFYSVTALFKRFMERLIVYAYWPWGTDAPEFRKKNSAKKKALVVSSCAAPALMGRFLFASNKQLKATAKTIGADTVGTIFTGLIAKEPHQALPEQVNKKVKTLASRLL